jgi:hypothetical protein
VLLAGRALGERNGPRRGRRRASGVRAFERSSVRSGKDEITLFDTTGSAIEDAAAALVYENAAAKGLGRTTNLYE